MVSRIQELQEMLKKGKTLFLSAKITTYGYSDGDESASVTAIYNVRVTDKSKARTMNAGISFSPKKFLKELEKLEKSGEVKVRQAGKVYLVDGFGGKVYCTIKVEDSDGD